MKTITKYILASALVAVLTIMSYGFYSLEQFHDNAVREEQEKLEMCIRTFWRLLTDKGTDFRIVNGVLMAGTYPVNGNDELPDTVQKIFGGVATIFSGDERVSTNVLDAEGKRAMGTRLEGPAYDAVLKQGKSYRGVATILGASYLTAYDPIRDSHGTVIGALFVGVKESVFLDRLHVVKMNMSLTLLSLVVVFVVLMILLGRAMKRVEDALANQINFLETLINTIPNPVFYKDSSCRYLGCNKAFEEYVGVSQEKLIGKTPHELWPEELADSYLKQDQELLNNPGMQAYEASVQCADGRLREVIFNKATYAGKDGVVAGLVAVLLDITERKEAENATKTAYQQLHDIVEFLPDATFVVDKEKRVIAWNRAIEVMTGVEKHEIIGSKDFSYAIPFYGDRRPILIDLLGAPQDVINSKYNCIKKEGRTLFTEAFVPSFRNGGSRYFWATASPLLDKQGGTVGAIESIRDITEYKQAEEERTRLLAQLENARLMEIVVNRLGHDLKTPLTPLFVMLPLIRKQLADIELESKIDICIHAAASINNLADRIRTLATLSARITPNQLERTSLAGIVDRTLSEYAAPVAQKRLKCQNNIDPAFAVRVVPAQFHQLFSNLISNAVHFSSAEGVITISAERSGETVLIAVRDEGVGLDSHHLEHIFDEFFKADESRHDLNATGLGLSICKRIVQNHHGRIWAESAGTGKGTTVRISLNEQDIDCIPIT